MIRGLWEAADSAEARMRGPVTPWSLRRIRKAFGHAAAPTKGPSAVKYGVNRQQIRVTGKTLLQFSREIWNYIFFLI